MSLPLLSGRCAVITGASRGIGAGLASDFAKRGLRLGLCSRSEPALAAGAGVVAERVDVRDADAMASFAARVEERFGVIDLWINNAGVLDPIAPLRDVEVADFRDHVDANLTGVFIGTRLYARHVRGRDGGGVLINVSSGAASNAYAGWGAYCASKAGVERLTECAQLEEADTGLRAYSVAPGVVDTAMQELIRGCPPERFPKVADFIAMKRADAYNRTEFVAQHLLEMAFDPDRNESEVALRLPYEG
jgi:NAD(P)-dependent dehydrogenase (short-subunit alcohol dehydrogenase family)